MKEFMMKAFHKLSITDIRSVLAFIIVLGSFATLIILLFKPIPAENKDTVNLAVGFVLGAGVGAVTGYYFAATKKETNPPL
jgi:hypothetical protein